MKNLILFGPPGSGKGTQSEKLVSQLGLKHISTGDLFRYHMKNDTDLGKLAKSFIEKGELVPDKVTVDMLKEEINKNNSSAGFIFDGFPRTIAQAEILDTILNEKGWEITKVISLEVPDDELRKRLKKRAEISGRPDDAKPEVIENRIRVYKQETEPVKAYYKKSGNLTEIDGVGEIDEIFHRILQAIGQ